MIIAQNYYTLKMEDRINQIPKIIKKICSKLSINSINAIVYEYRKVKEYKNSKLEDIKLKKAYEIFLFNEVVQIHIEKKNKFVITYYGNQPPPKIENLGDWKTLFKTDKKQEKFIKVKYNILKGYRLEHLISINAYKILFEKNNQKISFIKFNNFI